VSRGLDDHAALAARPLWIFSSEQRDLRDWTQIRSWAAGIGAELPASTAVRSSATT